MIYCQEKCNVCLVKMLPKTTMKEWSCTINTLNVPQLTLCLMLKTSSLMRVNTVGEGVIILRDAIRFTGVGQVVRQSQPLLATHIK